MKYFLSVALVVVLLCGALYLCVIEREKMIIRMALFSRSGDSVEGSAALSPEVESVESNQESPEISIDEIALRLENKYHSLRYLWFLVDVEPPDSSWTKNAISASMIMGRRGNFCLKIFEGENEIILISCNGERVIESAGTLFREYEKTDFDGVENVRLEQEKLGIFSEINFCTNLGMGNLIFSWIGPTEEREEWYKNTCKKFEREWHDWPCYYGSQIRNGQLIGKEKINDIECYVIERKDNALRRFWVDESGLLHKREIQSGKTKNTQTFRNILVVN